MVRKQNVDSVKKREEMEKGYDFCTKLRKEIHESKKHIICGIVVSVVLFLGL
jgi:hypothetical protein